MPLNCRVNIEQAQPKIQELLEQAHEATGVKFEFEVDYAALYAGLSADRKKDYGERLGDVMTWYLEPLVRSLRTACADGLKKESVQELCTAKKISFRQFATEAEYKKAVTWGGSYCRTRVVDGVLVMETKPDTFCSNVDYVLDSFDNTFAGNSDFPLALRVNMQEYAPKVVETLQELEEFSGVKFEFEVDYAGIYNSMNPDRKRDYGERIGWLMHAYLEALVRGLRSKLENPLRKEAFQEICSTKKIGFTMFPSAAEYKKPVPWGGSYCRIRVVDGTLNMETSADNMASNIDYVADTFDDAVAGNPDFPLTLRINMAEYAPKLQEQLEEIEEHTGIKFEFECDYAGLFKTIPADRKRDYGNRIGEVMTWYLGGLISGFRYKVENPLRKEAIAELCTAKKIGFHMYPTAAEYKKVVPWGTSYCRTRVVDGVLVMETNGDNFCSNVDNVLDCFDHTFMGNPVLPLAARVDIASSQEKRDEFVSRISAAVGKPFTFETDWNALTPLLVTRGYENRHGEVMTWYLEPLASNMENLCKDELGKEAINEKFPSDGLVRFVNDTSATGYAQCAFVAPNILLIKVHPEKMCSNVSETGTDLEKQL